MSRDTKDAEKAYLSRSGSLAWEQVKPFSPPATDTLAESTRLMHDFAVALHALDASRSQHVLDLGAGACWTSEWMARLNLRVTAVDIAVDMLAVGKARFAPRIARLAAGDLEALPFHTGSFDRAMCLNALHHVPSPPQALREIARVLDDRGRLVLIEPGRGHAERATSQTAMEEFGVLEQDLEAAVLMRMCRDAGFSRVALRPLSYMTGEIELTLDELSRWRTWTRTKRPMRALRKLARALLELPGLKKEGLLFEDALSMWTSRVLMRHIGEQAVVVADKSGYQPAVHDYRASIALAPDTAPRIADGLLVCDLVLRNAGSLTWSATARSGRVQLAVQLLDERRQAVNRDYLRVPLRHDVAPGDEYAARVECPLGGIGDARYVGFDLVAEDVSWFSASGSPPLVVSIQSRRG